MKKILSEQELMSKLQKCRLLALDFDGVLTDNSVYVDSNGKEMVRCDRYDSIGLGMLKKLDALTVVIVTNETFGSPVTHRAKKYGIDCCHVGPGREKFPTLYEFATGLNIGLENTCYVGNDVNDLDCLKNVGLAVAVADSHPDILGSVDFITSKPGGHGAVREICDLLLKVNKKEASP